MSLTKVFKKHVNPEESGELVEFYLERQQFMDPTKRHSIPVTVNGYPYEAVFGEKNILPKDVVKVLQNAKSAIHPMPNTEMVATALGGQGRKQSNIMQTSQQVQYINDYNVVMEKEL